ncbi:4-alpha-glucanotransferase [Caldichromatium japonicum]|uniref:4-alpha-glucanotransferase n=1 Tax=Caldichromatium japonicum TaxID=2699430 RepID=A0A6G7VB14_9GAMM|nr:4-alpha-glucanotransferase [Caldichromatium japonicum]QIK37263.1 4-alpha-glucanotransferase [Caldichromatium japonicum]
MHRTSGILLHPTSLPGPYGIGDLGPHAYRFVDFLAAAGQGIWQVLPLGPTGYRDSPYQCLSAFAGNPLLISPDGLVAAGWLSESELDPPAFSEERVDFGPVARWKSDLIKRAWRGFLEHASDADRAQYGHFCARQSFWLDDWALYQALKQEYELRPWTEWPQALARRDPDTLAKWSAHHRKAIELQRFIQYVFQHQWQEFRAYAHARGVRLVGDIPIFVAHDSSEVWTHPEWFELNDAGQPTLIAGVPPDYFSATGQRWGNPLYRWPSLAQDGYRFWVERLRRTLELVDWVRIDHFRGFAGYWAIPASEETAVNGRWLAGPGWTLFESLRAALGEALPLIAEDLGVITPDVEALRDGLGLPGMAVLQFGFEGLDDGFGASYFLPHHHRRELVVYTGTHDNPPVLGWWEAQPEHRRAQVCAYLTSPGEAIHWDLIRAALASVAALAIFPLQDLLGLGAEATMNRPGTAEGNWQWRYRSEQLDWGLADRLLRFSRLYGRRPYDPL